MNKIMDKYYLGLDLGTSSLKGIYKIPGGASFSIKIPYSENTSDNWISALDDFFAKTPNEIKQNLCAVSFSSQVGTYITDNGDVIPWFSNAGKEELAKIKSMLSSEECLAHIGMKHPDIISYPLPRLLYLKENKLGNKLQMPKEFLLNRLTGNYVTDYFSMRGIAHPQKGYAHTLIDKLCLSPELPRLCSPFECAGNIISPLARQYGLPENIPVYIGCNDFFAGLIGMGVYEYGSCFDISGTSEHFGCITEAIIDAPVSGAYFNGFCSYGGTKASGSSCDFAINNFTKAIDITLSQKPSTPIFLPYLQGERAPVFDENARGVFFGIHKDTTKEQMAYAVYEGVVFSLYDIARSMNLKTPNELICGGGSAKDNGMNRLRAEVIGCHVKAVTVNDASALGAAMLAMTADGAYKSLRDCIKENVSYLPRTEYTGEFTPTLRKRFDIYKDIYRSLKPQFKKFNEIYGR